MGALRAAMRGALRQQQVGRLCVEVAAAASQDSSKAKVLLGKPKSINRIWEKVSMEYHGRFQVAACMDLARGGIECQDMQALCRAMDYIAEHNGITPLRIKNRFKEETSGGWRDVMVNFLFNDDTEQHVCVLQIMHGHLLQVRRDMGAHHDYSIFRSAMEIVEYENCAAKAAKRTHQMLAKAKVAENLPNDWQFFQVNI